MSPKVFRWHVVRDLVVRHGWTRGAELGVSDGKFTAFLVEHCPTLHMLAVDLWAPQPGNEVQNAGESYSTWDHERSLKVFEAQIKPHRTQVTIHRMTTVEAAKLVPDASLDFVFIDACHAFECVMNDLEAWAPKVKFGGAVMGHDWTWPTVSQAVKTFYPNTDIVTGPNK